MARKLSAKQQLFVKEYLVDLNATKAAIRAGYKDNYANTNANKLLQNPTIQSAIAEALAKRSERTEIKADAVLKEIARIGFFDPRKLFNDDGTPKLIGELDDDTAASIVGLEVVSVGNAELGVGQVLKYKIADKNSALEKLCKHLGLYDADKSRKPELTITGFRMVPD
jgi:phage terminase small subunit